MTNLDREALDRLLLRLEFCEAIVDRDGAWAARVGITAVMDLVTNRANETMESLRRWAPRPQRPPTPEAVKIRDAEWLADPGAEGSVVPCSTKLSDGFAQDSWP